MDTCWACKPNALSLRVNKNVLYVASTYFDLWSVFVSDTGAAPGLDQRPYKYRPLTWHRVCPWLVAQENLSQDGLEDAGGFKKGSITIVLLVKEKGVLKETKSTLAV